MNLLDYLDRNAETHPKLDYISFGDENLNFRDFRSSVNKLAGGLRDIGIKRGDCVALMLPNIPRWLISYYAMLRLGGVVVPINIMLKENEIRYEANDSGIRAAVFWEGFSDELMSAVADVVSCELLLMSGEKEITGVYNIDKLIAGSPELTVAPEIRPEDTSLIIYTSGTTGRPKGAELSHSSIVSNAFSCSTLLPLAPGDKIIGVLPLFHSFGHTAVMNMAMVLGATIVLMPRFEPASICETIQRTSASLFLGVPSMYHSILMDKDVSNDAFDSVKYCISGASRLPPSLLERFEERFGVIILEGYGLSEAGPVVSFNRNASMRRSGSIGLPIDGMEMALIDESGNIVQPGEIGEIVVRGVSVMKGYLKKPEASMKAFSDGWLLTGDLGKMDEEGFYYIVDRKTDMIIKRGFNVYPKEIERILTKHVGVIECAVIGIPDEEVGELIKAYIVSNGDAKCSEEDITNYCCEKLARYKVPDIVEFMDVLPHNPTGKVMKKTLRDLHRRRSQT